MADSSTDSQGGDWILQGDWSGVGNAEDRFHPSETQTCNSHQPSRCAAQVPGGPEDRDSYPRFQAAPTSYSYEGGGPLRGFPGPPEGM